EHALKRRRDNLREAATEYYENLAKAVNIHASNKAELVRIERESDDHVVVPLNALDGGAGNNGAIFKRRFDADDTREIRLYLYDGADSVHISGDVASSIVVRVVGGDGSDVVIDKSTVSGYALAFLPIPDAETTTFVYDDGKKTRLELGASASYDDDPMRAPIDEAQRYEPLVEDFGHNWRVGPWLGFTSDMGLFVGGGPILYEYGFQADPYVYRMALLAGYATNAKSFKVQYTGDFRSLIDGARVGVLARASGIEVHNFYGLGNESQRIEEADKANHYNVVQQQLTFRPELGIPVFDGAEVIVGADVTHTKSAEPNEIRFVNTIRPYGLEPMTIANGSVGIRIDTRDVELNASKGVLFDVRGEYYPTLLDNAAAFTKIKGEARTYFTADWPLETTLALRAAAEHNIGDSIPFYKAAVLGGTGSLRGYPIDRFIGNTSLAANAELRVGLFNFNVLFPGVFGITAAVESGRVFTDDDVSKRWHAAVGGGLYLTFIERSLTLSASGMQSPEALRIYVAGGFAF
ncbi:MAG: BamA/TamA family outer membrane protein, partial [bacterium]|nr:BamA/TamA family outer membrane protein [Candidatus Kapabacteria bacterium]